MRKLCILTILIFAFSITRTLALTNIAVSNDNNFVFLENDGTGRLILKGEYDTGNPLPHGIVSGDFNRDGIYDVAVCHWQSGSFSVFFGRVGEEGITFSEANLYLIDGGIAIHAITSGDFNEDGFEDLALLDNDVSPRTVFIFINDGNGNFIQFNSLEIDHANTNSRSITAADFNNDGHLDLVVPDAITMQGHLTIFFGNAGGNFQREEVNLPDTEGSLYIMVADDVNTDGYLDLVSANGRYVSLVFNDRGEFRKVVNMPVGSPAPDNRVLSVAVGDFNNDGTNDIAAIKRNGLYIFLGTGEGEFKPGSLTLWPFEAIIMDIKTADFDDDGNLDLAMGVFGLIMGDSKSGVAIFKGKGDGSFPVEDSEYFSSGSSPGGYQTMLSLYPEPEPHLFIRGDVNNDGRLDLSDAIFILNSLFAGGIPPECLDSADVDDDGKLTIGDAIYLLNYMFSGGPAPKPPFPEAGVDPTADDLSCGGIE